MWSLLIVLHWIVAGTQTVFAGHSHGLDWCCPCKELWLCFARDTGYGGYGHCPRGARILDGNVRTQPNYLEFLTGHICNGVVKGEESTQIAISESLKLVEIDEHV